MSITFLLLLLFVGWVIYMTVKSKRELQALNTWCDTGDNLCEWQCQHVGVCIGTSQEGRRLLGKHIAATSWFLETHPHVGLVGYEKELSDLYFGLG